MAKQIYFTKVLALPNAEALVFGHLSAQQDDPSFTRLMLVANAGWKLVGDISEVVYAAARDPRPTGIRPDVCVVGRDGFFRILSGAKAATSGKIDKKDVSYLEAASYHGQAIYACGGQNQVYRFLDGVWQDCSQSIYEPFAGKLTASLSAMAPGPEGQMLFVGDHGALYLYGSDTWLRLDAPTNTNLLSAVSTPAGYLVGGARGVCLRVGHDGEPQELRESDEVFGEERLNDMCWYKNACYVAASTKLFRFADEQWKDVKIPIDPQVDSVVSVDAHGEYLWVTGGEHVFRFNGADWETLMCPDNQR